MTDAQQISIVEELRSESFYNINIDKDIVFCDSLIEKYRIKFKCVLSLSFPYELPTVYIEKDCYKDISPLPHINSDLSICTFDKSTVIPNFRFPTQIISASLKQARSIVRQGILKENTVDYYEEFNAYWNLKCDGEAESIATPTDNIKIIKCYFAEKKVYLADSKKELDTYLFNIGLNKRYMEHYHDCIYIPLNINICPPFPKTNYDLYRLIKSDTSIFKSYNNFIKTKISKGAFVAFSMPNKKSRSIQLWMHTGITGMVNGFRKGHIPLGIAYLKDTKKSPPLRFSVDDMRQERLFTRGGIGLAKGISKVAIIGCGSVGSYIVESLSEYGVDSFVLVDNEKLSTENIARHYCGYEYVGMTKVSAINNKLCKHNPNINAETYDDNGISFLDSHLGILNSCDIIFVATASTPLEYKVVELIRDLKIEKTVVIIWVEPYLAAGHALILKKPQNVFENLFDENYIFKSSVIVNSTDYMKKEAGCQSTFIPYAAFSLKRFIYTFLDYLLNDNLIKEKKGNYLFTWCGNFPAIQDIGGKIALDWVDSKIYSTHVKRID